MQRLFVGDRHVFDIERVDAVHHRLQVAAQHGDGRAQFVGDIGGHLLAHLLSRRQAL